MSEGGNSLVGFVFGVVNFRTFFGVGFGLRNLFGFGYVVHAFNAPEALGHNVVLYEILHIFLKLIIELEE